MYQWIKDKHYRIMESLAVVKKLVLNKIIVLLHFSFNLNHDLFGKMKRKASATVSPGSASTPASSTSSTPSTSKLLSKADVSYHFLTLFNPCNADFDDYRQF